MGTSLSNRFLLNEFPSFVNLSALTSISGLKVVVMNCAEDASSWIIAGVNIRYSILGVEITRGSNGVEHKSRQDENEPLTRQFRRKDRMELDRTSGLQILWRGV